LKSITISPLNAALTSGWKRQFVAVGVYSSGPSQKITTPLLWSSSADRVVLIDNTGLATPQAVTETKNATIKATDPSNPAITASTKVTVAPDPMPSMAPEDEGKAEAFGHMDEALHKKPPDKKALKELVDKNGGHLLDLLVKDMPDPPDRAEIAAAIEARFNIKFTDIDADDDDAGVEGNKSIKMMYLTMLKVPEDDVRNNPSLKQMIREPAIKYDPDGHNFAFYQNKKAVFPAMRADVPANALGDPKQLPDVEDACKPSGSEQPTFLAWNTLHEVAHGVDDHKKVMKEQGGNAKAGWNLETVDTVAAALATKLEKYDVNAITALLTAKDLKTVAKPAGATDDQQDKAIAWCKAIRTENELWEKGAESVARAIGGRVYHQAYPAPNHPEWVSYSVDARKKGITGYQFRAPGEWFAELYAAYFSGKLKKNHPYGDWVKQF
jgi:hypothetical protein